MAARKHLLSFLPVLALVTGAVAGAVRPEPLGAQAGVVALPMSARHALAEPGISPDGREIAFVSGGDIWSVPAAGGEARLLVSHPAHESRPLYSPDGTSLAFVSTRTGNGDVYLLSLATGDLRRLTWDDAPEMIDGWTPDSSAVLVSSPAREVSSLNDISLVRVAGGTPALLTAEPYTNEFFGAVSPDGATLAFSARGIAAAQWWRHGHSHIDESEIWTLDLSPGASGPMVPRYRQLVARGAKALWPMWDADGRTLYFVSDRSGSENLWVRTPDGTSRAITAFDGGRVLWPSISRSGAIAFEREFGIWTVDVSGGAPRELPIVLRGSPAAPAVDHVRATGQFQSLAVSPDGLKLAFTARGDVFAAGVKDGGDAARLTRTPAAETSLAWAPDSRRLVYAAARGDRRAIYQYDFSTRQESSLSDGAGDDYSPVFSPDGRSLAFIRDGRELRVLTLETRQHRLVTSAELPPAFDVDRAIAWSPDGRWIAFLAAGEKSFTNAWVVEAAGGTPRAVSALPNAFSGGLLWSPDGTCLLMVTGQRTELRQVARVDLVARAPRFREDTFRDLFTRGEPPAGPAPRDVTPRPADARPLPGAAATPAASSGQPPAAKPVPPTIVDFEGIRHRVSLLPLRMDVGDIALSADGKLLAFTAQVGGRENVFTWSLDELAKDPPVATQVTSSAGAKSSLHVSPDGKDLVLLDDGRVVVATLERKEARPVQIAAELDVDFALERHEVFRQGWSLLRDLFYDEAMHGADWPAQRARFAPYVAGASSPDELRRLMSLMIGELNASHLGISAPPSGGGAVTGRLGVSLDAAELGRTGRLRIASIVPLGPVDLARSIRPGDVIVAIDGEPIGASTALGARLEHTVGRQVRLAVTTASGADRREVEVKPVDLSTERRLRYRAWVESRRQYVDKASGGRLGYVHIPDMGAASLDQLYFDLDADNHAREGVVIDVRNNNGGFVNVYAIDVFARRPYLTMTQRGREGVPARSALGQRALERPTVLVTNQHSLSDAEDFSEGYRTLGLGRIVGEPTAGWIIYTWNTRLVDGSSFRLPRTRITGADGRNMERNPRPVDVPVSRALGEDADGIDSQLDAAVKVLLESLGR